MILERIDREQVTDWYYPNPVDGRKSFYKKATVYETKKFYYLKMYMCQEEVTDEFVKSFKKDYDNLNPKVKKILADSDVMVHSKEEAEELMKISQLFSLLMD